MGARSDRIARLLENPPTSTIDFHLGGLLVTPRGFVDIAGEFRAGNITLAIDRTMPESAGAKYQEGHNRLVVCTTFEQVFNTPWGGAVLVHEAVHAMIDRNRAVRTTVLHAEAAAYIAQVLYLLHTDAYGTRRSAREHGNSPEGAIFVEAIRLIDRYHLEYRPGIVPLRASAPLQEAIHRHPLYQDVSADDLVTADGI